MLEAECRARLASIYGHSSDIPPISESLAQDDNVELNNGGGAVHGGQEFEFRLFSSGPGDWAKEASIIPQKILLLDEEEDVGEGGFVVRERNRKYYFAEKANGETHLGFESMALSGEEVLSRARKRAWGLEVLWRVRVLKAVGKKGSGEAAHEVVCTEDAEGDIKRKRPGKKRRIMLRARQKLRDKLKEQKQVEKEKKEEAEREKRTRRNREKKVKRKMKEKAKKTGDATRDSSNDAKKIGESAAAGVDAEMLD